MTTDLAARLADRHFGVGCDQILLAQPANDATADFKFRIFNADGSEVAQCGNGARCFARFLQQHKLTGQSDIIVETLHSRMTLSVQSDDTVCVEMGIPEFAPAKIPLLADKRRISYSLCVDDQNVEVCALAIGNPHAVHLVDDVASVDIESIGASLQAHASFPERVNAGFMQLVSAGEIKLRVYERGVGETLGCGSGACAAVVAGIILGKLDTTVSVLLPGGEVSVSWEGEGRPVYLSGPAHNVYTGNIEI